MASRIDNGGRLRFARGAGLVAIGLTAAMAVTPAASMASKKGSTSTTPPPKVQRGLVRSFNAFFLAFEGINPMVDQVNQFNQFHDVRTTLEKGRTVDVKPLAQRLKLVVLRPELSAFAPISRFPIHTPDIADGAVTAPKLAPGAVTGASVAPHSLTIGDMADIATVQEAIDIPSVPANSCTGNSFPAPGSHAGQTPVIGFTGDTPLPAGLTAEALKVPADGTVNVRFCNATNSASAAGSGVNVRFTFLG